MSSSNQFTFAPVTSVYHRSRWRESKNRRRQHKCSEGWVFRGGFVEATAGSGNVDLSNINGDVRIVAISSGITVQCVRVTLQRESRAVKLRFRTSTEMSNLTFPRVALPSQGRFIQNAAIAENTVRERIHGYSWQWVYRGAVGVQWSNRERLSIFELLTNTAEQN